MTAIVGCACLFIAGELAVRRWARAPENIHRDLAPIVWEGWSPCCAVETFRGVDYWVAKPSRYAPNAFKYPKDRASGDRRTVVLGESSAYLLGEEIARLASQSATGRHEVFNCASGGSSLAMLEKRFDEALAFAPDTVVILFGHNLSFHYPRVHPWLFRAAWHARRSELINFAVDRLWGSPSPPPPFAAQQDAFHRFLHRAATSARNGSFRLVLCTLPLNLRYPPLGEDADRSDPRYLDAVFRYITGEKKPAIRLLERLVLADPRPLWHHRLAEWFLTEGETAAARRHFEAALDGDGHSQRARTSVNEMLRGFAHKEAVTLLDFDRLVRDRAPSGIPGWETFVDHCHVSETIAQWQARVFFARTENRAERPTARAPRPDVHRVLELAARAVGIAAEDVEEQTVYFHALAGALADALIHDPAAQPAVRRFVASQTFAGLPGKQTQSRFLLSIAQAFEAAGRPGEADFFNDEAMRFFAWEEPLFQRGLFELGRGRSGTARDLFDEAVKINSGRADIRYFSERLRARDRFSPPNG
jgi:tetratricopeptide (TPR) repeat protein